MFIQLSPWGWKEGRKERREGVREGGKGREGKGGKGREGKRREGKKKKDILAITIEM